MKMTSMLFCDKRDQVLISVATLMLIVGSCPFAAFSQPPTSRSIGLETFRWSQFPLTVLLDMNVWSRPEYALSVREALDGWMKSIWNFTHTFSNNSLPVFSYVLHLSNVNSTSDYDVFITFSKSKMPPDSNAVGLTAYQWNPATHSPIPPIEINITTFSATAESLFVRNIAMHEFGHALGLNHADSATTLNGPELMYPASSKDQIVYPSTVDVYGLTALYEGKYNMDVELPSEIPYMMLTQGEVILPQIDLWESYKKYVPLAAALLLLIAAVAVIAYVNRNKKPEPLEPPSPPQLP